MPVTKLCLRIALSAGVVLSSACTTLGPDFKTPPADLEAVWNQQSQALDTSRVSQDWWTIFNDPVLDKLVESAYRQNLPLQIAGLRIFEARAQLGIAIVIVFA